MELNKKPSFWGMALGMKRSEGLIYSRTAAHFDVGIRILNVNF